MESEFKPCSECASHPDTLCDSCQHNARIIAKLRQDLQATQELASPVWASKEEQEFWDRVEWGED